MKPRCFKLTTEPYNYHVYVLESSKEQGARWLKKHHCPIGVEGQDGLTWAPDGDPDVFIWFEAVATLNTIAHELIHATYFVLSGSGLPITLANQEAVAYLHGHLLERCVAKLNAQRMKYLRSGVAQSAERHAVNVKDVGSTPTPGAAE